ncbi:MAG: type II secretion system protein GspD, partial [Magnetococcales bacterium]|nr:type II secretion system protein GspD [Magnetococcales bacterium]
EKVPVLGDLPLLGGLFRAEGATDEKRNLMVFLRPRILRTREEGIRLTHEKYRSMRETQLAAPRALGPVTLEGGTPLLPELQTPLRMDRGISTPSAPPVSVPDNPVPVRREAPPKPVRAPPSSRVR